MKGSKGGYQPANRGARTYLTHAVKAASHPVRREILKTLKGGPQSSLDLEDKLGESRYNLYHHLDVLSEANLIQGSASKDDSKAKQYQLKEPKRPDLALFLFEEEELAGNSKLRDNMFDLLELIGGKEIPHRDKIVSAEVHLRYPWSK